MPSASNSSPVIMGDRVFVCSDKYMLYCLNSADGSILWQRENGMMEALTANEKAELAKVREQDGPILKAVEDLQKQREVLQKESEKASPDRRKEIGVALQGVLAEITRIEKENETLLKVSRAYTAKFSRRNLCCGSDPICKADCKLGDAGYSTPTPASDGKNVYVLYHNGVAAAYDPDGNRKWIRYVERSAGRYCQVASPLIIGDRLIVHLTGLTALNAATGETIWQTEADIGRLGNGSPSLVHIGDKDFVVTIAGDVVNVRDGRKCRFDAPPKMRSCWNSPLVDKDTIYFNWASPTWAGRLTLDSKGEITTTVLWTQPKLTDIFYTTPVVVDGLLYTVEEHGTLRVLDAANGQIVYEKPLGFNDVYPSLVVAGGYIYASNNSVVVIKPGREYQEVARNPTDGFQTTPVFHNNRLYIRTRKDVICIGENQNGHTTNQEQP